MRFVDGVCLFIFEFLFDLENTIVIPSRIPHPLVQDILRRQVTPRVSVLAVSVTQTQTMYANTRRLAVVIARAPYH